MTRVRRIGIACPGRLLLRGFTLLELTASIAIVGVLMALLIPAVQNARETGRRMNCQNHLRQFGTAIHSFESAHGEYPRWRGPVFDIPLTLRMDYRDFSIHRQLLSHLEQRALDDHPGWGVAAGPHWEPRIQAEPENVRLPIFFCPSDDGPFGTNYRACTGPDAPEAHRGRDGGVFGRVDSTRPQDVTDGTSHTVMMSEKLISDLTTAYNPRTDYWYTGLNSVQPNISLTVTSDEMLYFCGSSSGSPAAYFPYTGLEWHPASFNDTLYNHVAPPNSPVPDCSLEGSVPNATVTPGQGGNIFQRSGSFGADSAHGQGVNALVADGAVRFVSNAIDTQLWRALATIAGEEVVEF